VWRKATRLNRQKAVVVRRPGTAEGPGSVRSGAGSSPPDAASGRGRHGGHPSAAAYCDLRRTRSFLSQSHEATKDGGRSLGLAASRPERRRWPAQGGLTLRGLDLTFLLDRCWSDGRRRSLGPAPATCFVSLWLRVRKMDLGRSWPSAIASWDKPRHLVARVSDVAALRLGWNALSLTRCGEPREESRPLLN
jgi:hypothetical protein